MASRGRGARQKGANFEREIAKLFSEKLERNFKRGLGQTRGGGAEVADVEIGQDSEDLFHFELKRHKRSDIKAAMRQAVSDIEEGLSNKVPVAITKDDYKPIYVTMLLDDFLTIAKVYMDHVDTQRAQDNK